VVQLFSLQTSRPPTPPEGPLITNPDDSLSKINTEARPRIQAKAPEGPVSPL
jgi:hypothetical protein